MQEPTPPRRILRTMMRDALMTSPFFQSMKTGEVDEIVGFATERRVAKGTVIFNKGDPGSSMMAVLTGRIRASNVSIDGKEVTLNVFGPGEIFGEIALLDGKTRSADVTASEDSLLMVVERKHFMPFALKHDTMMERLLIVLCDRLRKTSTALEEIALHDLPARLARVLTKLAADYGRPLSREDGGGTRIELKLSQRDLSTLVASSRESVNKQLRLWREEGIVDQDSGHVIIRKPNALLALFE